MDIYQDKPLSVQNKKFILDSKCQETLDNKPLFCCPSPKPTTTPATTTEAIIETTTVFKGSKLIFIFVQFFTPYFFTAGASCKNPQNKNGVCVKFRECPKLFQIFQNTPISPKNRELLRKSQCAFKDKVAYVCCVEEDEVTTLAPVETTTPEGTEPDWLKTLKQKVPEAPDCGNDAEGRIFGGSATEIDEFSWTVLLEYKKREFVQFFFEIIDNRFLLNLVKSMWQFYITGTIDLIFLT